MTSEYHYGQRREYMADRDTALGALMEVTPEQSVEVDSDLKVTYEPGVTDAVALRFLAARDPQTGQDNPLEDRALAARAILVMSAGCPDRLSDEIVNLVAETANTAAMVASASLEGAGGIYGETATSALLDPCLDALLSEAGKGLLPGSALHKLILIGGKLGEPAFDGSGFEPVVERVADIGRRVEDAYPQKLKAHHVAPKNIHWNDVASPGYVDMVRKPVPSVLNP